MNRCCPVHCCKCHADFALRFNTCKLDVVACTLIHLCVTLHLAFDMLPVSVLAMTSKLLLLDTFCKSYFCFFCYCYALIISLLLSTMFAL